MRISRTWLALALVAPAALAGCTSPPQTPVRAAAHQAAAPPAPLSVALSPGTGRRDLPVTTEIAATVANGRVESLRLVDSGGHAVTGRFRDDWSSWVPAEPLDFDRAYTATVVAAGAGGQQVTRTSTFRTMARPYGERIGTGLYLFDGDTYGVAMPIAVEFDTEIPPSARAAVERRLFVTASPRQAGVWHWYGGRQVLYRPRVYWQPGTRITVRAALGGLPVAGRFVDVDRSATVRIGQPLEMRVSDRSKQMTVYRDGRPIRTIPVSLGKPSTPSSSGHMVVMSHEASTIFDTTREGPGGYRVQISYAMRLTWGGEFIHAAPWSVGDQGHRDVSHGCVNMSTGNAAWLFSIARIGDPVTVSDTGTPLVDGNGWTAWNMPWPAYVTGSALAHPDLLRPPPGPWRSRT
jgi:lipoprotein-anchoring transpeptidase ErfK/SrfK